MWSGHSDPNSENQLKNISWYKKRKFTSKKHKNLNLKVKVKSFDTFDKKQNIKTLY